MTDAAPPAPKEAVAAEPRGESAALPPPTRPRGMKRWLPKWLIGR